MTKDEIGTALTALLPTSLGYMEDVNELMADHEANKKVRGRGTETPGHLASIQHLQKLEEEFKAIREALDTAWANIDSKNFRRCSRSLDNAQQRLHKAIKKLTKAPHDTGE